MYQRRRLISIDLNVPTCLEECVGGGCEDLVGVQADNEQNRQADGGEQFENRIQCKEAGSCRVSKKHGRTVVEDVGCKVKNAREVLKFRRIKTNRRPNVNCRVKLFGRICRSLDERGRKLVSEMGFGGLLHLVDWQLRRTLCYWLMTRVDPFNEMLCVGDKSYRLSSNQVRWVLGLPKGERVVPKSCESSEWRDMLDVIIRKYGGKWTTVEGRSNKLVTRRGLAVTREVVKRMESEWGVDEANEFKVLFLMCALVLVLCPTQSQLLSPDLFPSLSCAIEARKYDWCSLVLQKLMASGRRFSPGFNKHGYVSGCGGCTLFLAVFYLDRLARNPLMWGARPRVKVWNPKEIKRACVEDKSPDNGDFGSLGVLDVAYGEAHPREARDTNFTSDEE